MSAASSCKTKLAFLFLAIPATLIFMTEIASARDTDVADFQIHQQYVSARALGMGNAFTALADDYSALFYNPAGLSRLNEATINMGVMAMMDSKTPSLVSDIGKASKGDDGQKVQQMVDLLDKNLGNVYGARVTLNGVWSRPKWALAIIPLDLSIDAGIHQLAGYSLDLIARQDTTIAYGRGWDVYWFKSGRTSLGVTGKAVYRGYYNTRLLAVDLVNNNDLLRADLAREGMTFDADFGMLYSPTISEKSWWRWTRPSFGLTVRNIADYGFFGNQHLLDKNSGNDVPKLGRRLDLGSLWELPDWWIFKTRFLADLRDIGHENFTFQKGMHLGAEFNWRIFRMWQGGWRVGVNQGYFTAGFTGKLGPFQLDLTTYAEEVGPSSEPKSSRRYVAKASFDF